MLIVDPVAVTILSIFLLFKENHNSSLQSQQPDFLHYLFAWSTTKEKQLSIAIPMCAGP